MSYLAQSHHLRCLRFVGLLALTSAPAWSQDISYDAATSILTIPSVQVGTSAYTNVTLRNIGIFTFTLEGATVQALTGPALATYDIATAILMLPAVRVGADTFGVTMLNQGSYTFTLRTAASISAIPTWAASKYAGTWTGCEPQQPTTSKRLTIVYTPQAADMFAFSGAEVQYAAPACAGAAGSTDAFAGTATLTGTKIIGAETVDKVTLAQIGAPAEQQVYLLKGTGSNTVTLQFGLEARDGGGLDAEGYPNTLDHKILTRQ
jgi:hypothetical protein